MDASDTTKKRKTTVAYIHQLNAFVAGNTLGCDCSSFNSKSCIKTFASYEAKYDYYNGVNNCLRSTILYPVNGGSQ